MANKLQCASGLTILFRQNNTARKTFNMPDNVALSLVVRIMKK